MKEHLSGDLNSRLYELRDSHGFKSGAEVAEAIHINRTTYNRIENGSTQTISSDILIALSKLYGVSTDYILGLSDIRENTVFDVEELGLSIEAARNLYTKKTDPRVVNELLINPQFAILTSQLARYFSGEMSEMAKVSNKSLDFMNAILADSIASGQIPNNEEIQTLRKQIQGNKISVAQSEIDKIKNTFVACIREIKEKVQNEISEYLISQLFTPDNLEAIKAEALNDLYGKTLTEEEKIARATIATTEIMRLNPVFNEDVINRLTENIQGIYATLADMENEKKKE